MCGCEVIEGGGAGCRSVEQFTASSNKSLRLGLTRIDVYEKTFRGCQTDFALIFDVNHPGRLRVESDYVPRAQVPPRFGDSSEVLSRLIEVQATTKKESDPPTLLEDFDEEKRKRIEARWKRLGINMRTIQYPIKNV
ncbi:hypothetical protein Q1695_012654 [Nippostrongylus brasiliensis]|nr:hypothetical protein Q1695_012654 [Nippostrongylus brasiliensis]